MTLGILTAFSRDIQSNLLPKYWIPVPLGVAQCLGKGSSKMETVDRNELLIRKT